MVITSPAALISLANQVEKETKEAYSPQNRHKWTNPWIEYDTLKYQLEQFENIDDKIKYLRQFELFDCGNYIRNKKSFDLAIKCLKEELYWKREKEYYDNIYNSMASCFNDNYTIIDMY